MSLEDRIDSIGGSIARLARELTEKGFRFKHPDEVFPGPERNAAESIARVEHEIGGLPLALKRFWTRIGSVNFCGEHPSWAGCDYPDPLVVYPPSMAVEELHEFLADRVERLKYNFPYLIPIAPDLYHKAGMSGGMWYNIAVPCVADDPLLNDEWHETTFVRYLELAVEWAGFPGLSCCPNHTWAVDDLIRSRAEGKSSGAAVDRSHPSATDGK